jgi:hypothetical protein
MVRVLVGCRNGLGVFNDDDFDPESGTTWKWTNAFVERPTSVWDRKAAGRHLLPRDVAARVDSLISKQPTPQTLSQRQPVLISARTSDTIAILDLDPVAPGSSIMSIVVETGWLDTRGCGCERQVREVVKHLREHPPDLNASRTTALALTLLLRRPIISLNTKLDQIETGLEDLEDRLSPTLSLSHLFRPDTRGHRKQLAIVRKLLCAYSRVCESLMDPHGGSFREQGAQGERRELASVRENIRQERELYIRGLRDLIASSIRKEEELSSRMQGVERLLASRRGALMDVLLALLTFVLLPANLVAAFFGMNFKMPGDAAGGSKGLAESLKLLNPLSWHTMIPALKHEGGFWPAVVATALFALAVVFVVLLAPVVFACAKMLGGMVLRAASRLKRGLVWCLKRAGVGNPGT